MNAAAAAAADAAAALLQVGSSPPQARMLAEDGRRAETHDPRKGARQRTRSQIGASKELLALWSCPPEAKSHAGASTSLLTKSQTSTFSKKMAQ